MPEIAMKFSAVAEKQLGSGLMRFDLVLSKGWSQRF